MGWSDTLQILLRQISPQLIALVLNLLESIRAYVKQKSPEGLYEILEYETKLELLDVRGRRAHLSKYQRIKFIQDHVIAFEDYARGQGNVLAEYKCSPGFEADRYLEGDQLVEELLNRGNSTIINVIFDCPLPLHQHTDFSIWA